MTTKKTWLYLEWLRRTGQTNMFGAVPYLINEFGFDNEKAKEVLSDWIQNYNPDDYPDKITPKNFN